MKWNVRASFLVLKATFNIIINVKILTVDPEILNALKWSHDLDEVFRENYESDKEILWQYFGSQTGFMRSFPGLYM